MKYPYGISDFRSIIRENYFYCDRTDRISLLEESKSILFLRPRRFGKSLLLSMLLNYYDVKLKDRFEGRIPIFPVMQLSVKYENYPFVSGIPNVLLYNMSGALVYVPHFPYTKKCTGLSAVN